MAGISGGASKAAVALVCSHLSGCTNVLDCAVTADKTVRRPRPVFFVSVLNGRKEQSQLDFYRLMGMFEAKRQYI